MGKIVNSIGRRGFLVGAGSATLALTSPFIKKSYAAEQLVIRDSGGVVNAAAKIAFYEPFMKETGIRVVDVTSQLDPLSQIRTIVESKSYLWDVSHLSMQSADILGASGYLETIDPNLPYVADVLTQAKSQWSVSFHTYATIFAYNTERYGEDGPKNWADFFDVKKFHGRRAMRKSPTDTLEIAMLASGASLSEVYPIQLDRAFNALDTIKNDVGVWWNNGAQSSQAIAASEVDMVATYNGRAQVAIDDGAPYKIQWNQGIWAADGYCIPKGNPKVELGKKFIEFCSRPDRQAAYSSAVPYSPTNPKAYDLITADHQQSLPTIPGRIEHMVMQDHLYWAENLEKVTDRFNQWLVR